MKPEQSSHSLEYWSMSYRGQEIAIQRHNNGWLIYLNKVLQHGMVFNEARAAANWLRRRVDNQATTVS